MMTQRNGLTLVRDEIWNQSADDFNEWDRIDREDRYQERLFWMALSTGAITFGAFCFALGAIVAGA